MDAEAATAPVPDSLRILPLGGLGEIGLNMMAFECRGKILIVDCGLMFPEAYMLGIDLVVPDISCLAGREADILGLVLTHGHEDHIGGVPFLLETLGNPPIFGSPLTVGLLRGKLTEHGLLDSARMTTVRPRETIDLEPFQVEFFRAAHSIVDGMGLAVRSPVGLVVHTGDFKLDPTPVDGEVTDLARLAQYGEEGVLLLLSDSTNVEREGHTLSERIVGERLTEILPACTGLILVSTFSSNIHRIQQIADAAVACGRQIVVSGRSMQANIKIARELGCLRIPDESLIDLRQMKDLPRQRVLVITTGSQGEPLSALTRIAVDDHKQLSVESGDTVILSSKFIPGNERAITDLINHLYRRGAEVFYETTSEIHVSGHACQEELKQVLALTRPRYFVPIHGEYRHLVKHAQLARGMGIPEERIFVVENGYPLVFGKDGVNLESRAETGRVFIDGKGVGDVGSMELRDRRHLANHGMLIVLLALNQSSGEILYGPDFLTRGFIPEDEGQGLLDEAREAVRQTLAEHSLEAVSDWEEIRVEVRKTLRRFFNKAIERRPLILPVIMEL